MKKTLALSFILLAAAAGLAQAGEPVTLTGQFQWVHMGSPGDIEAVFTPAGDDAWEVAFHFTFRGTPHTYSGTASGSLTEGTLEGRVQNEEKKRTFTFSGTLAENKFDGTHAEVTKDGTYDTGTIWLKR